MADRQWHKQGSKTVYTDQWLQVTVDDVVQPDGQESTYTVFYIDDGVAVLAVDERGGMYFVRQHRYAMNVMSLEVPGGGTDVSRNFKHQAQLELQQETGITAKSWEQIHTIFVYGPRSPAKVYFFVATDLDISKLGVDNTDDGGAISEVVYMTDAEVRTAVRNGDINDSTTLAILAAYWARQ